MSVSIHTITVLIQFCKKISRWLQCYSTCSTLWLPSYIVPCRIPANVSSYIVAAVCYPSLCALFHIRSSEAIPSYEDSVVTTQNTTETWQTLHLPICSSCAVQVQKKPNLIAMLIVFKSHRCNQWTIKFDCLWFYWTRRCTSLKLFSWW